MNRTMTAWQLLIAGIAVTGSVMIFESAMAGYRSDQLALNITNNVLPVQDMRAIKNANSIVWQTEKTPLKAGGNAEPEVTKDVWVFSDPGCPHCKSLDAVLQQIPGLIVHTILFPAPKSVQLATTVWCSPDQTSAWKSAIAGEDLSEMSCLETPFTENAKLARILKIFGTPTLFNSSGQRLDGTSTLKVIEAFLAHPSE